MNLSSGDCPTELELPFAVWRPTVANAERPVWYWDVSNMPPFEISRVSAESQWKYFIDLPWTVYPRKSNWVPPLKREVRRILDARHHPFWKSAEQILFLALRDSVPVGRIAGIIDQKNNQINSELAASWGFFECQNDREVAQELFAAVEAWARSQGMKFLRGPLNPSINYEAGLLVDGFDHPPSIMMPYTPEYYIPLVESSGFTKEIDLLSFRLPKFFQASERVERLADRVRARSNVWYRNWSKKGLKTEMTLIRELFNSAWRENWGFVPLTDDEVVEMSKELVRIIDWDFCFFIYSGDKPIGLAMTLPDVNPLLTRLNGRLGITGIFKALLGQRQIKGLRLVLFGIKKEYRRLGLPLILLDPIRSQLRKSKRYQYLDMGWTLETNGAVNQYIIELGPIYSTRHRIFLKQIGS